MKMLRNLLIGTATAVALASVGSSAFAADAAVNASIIQPISITKVDDISFGTVARPASGSATVTLSPTANAVSGVTVVTQGSRGEFTVTGDGGQTYTLTGGTGAVTLTRSGGAETLTFTPNVVASSGTLGTFGGSLYSASSQTLWAGGSFPITSTTVAGAYSGTLSLTVAYN